jgi:hypothetical protein
MTAVEDPLHDIDATVSKINPKNTHRPKHFFSERGKGAFLRILGTGLG